MVSRGLIKEYEKFERIDLAPLYFILKDYAIELEIEHSLLHEAIILSSSSQNPERFAILDKVHKLYNQNHKSSIEKLIEDYKKEFGDGTKKPKEIKIRLRDPDKNKVSQFVKQMPQK